MEKPLLNNRQCLEWCGGKPSACVVYPRALDNWKYRVQDLREIGSVLRTSEEKKDTITSANWTAFQ